jgi:hypothetical protein
MRWTPGYAAMYLGNAISPRRLTTLPPDLLCEESHHLVAGTLVVASEVVVDII